MEGPSTEAPKEETKVGPSRGAAEADDEDEVPDMDEFQDDNNVVEDDAVSCGMSRVAFAVLQPSIPSISSSRNLKHEGSRVALAVLRSSKPSISSSRNTETRGSKLRPSSS